MVKDELKSIEQQIIEIIEKKGYASLAELKNLFSRQSLMGNLRKLHAADKLRSYVKLDDSVTQKAIQPSEIYFTLKTKYQYQYEINKLIDRMCGDDIDSEQAYESFMELCRERDPVRVNYFTISYNNVAHALISGLYPELRKKVVMCMITGNNVELTDDEKKVICGKLYYQYYG